MKINLKDYIASKYYRLVGMFVSGSIKIMGYNKLTLKLLDYGLQILKKESEFIEKYNNKLIEIDGVGVEGWDKQKDKEETNMLLEEYVDLLMKK